ncbi:MAG: LAGLIDADG family homing endonuclease, partial [Thermoproteota archaeon]
RIRQYERRFYEGERVREEREDEIFHSVGFFGEYEVREAEGGGYELIRKNEVIGIFSEAKVEKGRIVFKLSHGVNLEVTEKGIREIFSPERAELCGLIAADGSISKYQEKKGKSTMYKICLKTNDQELAEVFSRLFKETYGVTSHRYIGHHTAEGKERQHYEEVVYSKKVAYDLWNFNIKGPGRYEFHPPTKYLDEEGKKAYIRGFFSGDGSVTLTPKEHHISIHSSCRECLEELRKMLIDLGFHPGEIGIYDKEPSPKRHSHPSFRFYIPEEDHLKFIEEIGSEREMHINKFKQIKLIDEERRKRRNEI